MFTTNLTLSLTLSIQREEIAVPVIHVKVDGKDYRCFMSEEQIIQFKDKLTLALHVIRHGQRVM